ncbi:hypothetical protein PPERSA_04270 [Pseudocohnilembus persalinus]|uniref:Uncharacterized protein n=1 Tax=Pseudocohnilembus persalinus TaxID=266149 RepID=A0A0V0QNB7_PSEPJ|nr:hypothetical protein PPERSA_04270 [Pseudocohnilembus persalinus]|eukprot:KRX03762.1 hypothetical protein PPERSA_04270 [Pseudocohnilembus persalinus]
MKSTNFYKPNIAARPYSGKSQKSINSTSSQNQESNGLDLGLGLGVTGNKIKKGYQIPEKYQVSKPDFSTIKQTVNSARNNQQNQNLDQDSFLSGKNNNNSKVQQQQQLLKKDSFQKYNKTNNINEYKKQLQNETPKQLTDDNKQNNQQNQLYEDQEERKSNFQKPIKSSKHYELYKRSLEKKNNNSNKQRINTMEKSEKSSNIFDSFIKSDNAESDFFASQYSQQQDLYQDYEEDYNAQQKNDFQAFMNKKLQDSNIQKLYDSKLRKVEEIENKIYQQKNKQLDDLSSQNSASFHSKPFNTRGSFKKQKDIANNSQSEQMSIGSTHLTQAKTDKTHSQKPSQDIVSIGNQDQISEPIMPKQNTKAAKTATKLQSKPFKLNELGKQINKKDSDKKNSNDNNNNNNNQQIKYGESWQVVQQAPDKASQERTKKQQELMEYLQKMKKDKKLPQNFEKIVDDNLYRMKYNEEQDISKFEFKEIDENDEMSQMEVKLGKYMEEEQNFKLKEFNQALEESRDDLSQVSMDDIKKNLLFITQFGRKSQQQFDNNNSQYSVNSNNQSKQQQEKSTERLFKGRKNDQENQYFVELNKRLAFMNEDQKVDAQMRCDLLPEPAKQRLNELLDDIENFDEEEEYKKLLKQENPFQQNREQEAQIQNKIYEIREQIVLQEDEACMDMNEGILNVEVLPKDKTLREEAETRILQNKLKDVNSNLLKLAQSEKVQGNAINKQQIEKICQNLKEQMDYHPGPLLQSRLQQMQDLQKQHQEALQMLDELQKESSIIQDFEIIRKKIEENLEKVKRGEIIEAEKASRKYEMAQLDFNKQFNKQQQNFMQENKSQNKINNQAKQNQYEEQIDQFKNQNQYNNSNFDTNHSQNQKNQSEFEQKNQEDDLPEYTLFKNEIEKATNYVQDEFMKCQQQEEILLEKIKKWQQEMQIFDEIDNVLEEKKKKEEKEQEERLEREDPEYLKQKQFNHQMDLEDLDKILEQQVLEKNPDLKFEPISNLDSEYLKEVQEQYKEENKNEDFESINNQEKSDMNQNINDNTQNESEIETKDKSDPQINIDQDIKDILS